MLQAQTKRLHQALGLREETVKEIASIFVMMAGVLVLLSLASQGPNGNLIGRLGTFIFLVLTFVLGQYVAYVVPALALAWSAGIWRGCTLMQAPLRVLGMFGCATSVCALLAMQHSEADLARAAHDS